MTSTLFDLFRIAEEKIILCAALGADIIFRS